MPVLEEAARMTVIPRKLPLSVARVYDRSGSAWCIRRRRGGDQVLPIAFRQNPAEERAVIMFGATTACGP